MFLIWPSGSHKPFTHGQVHIVLFILRGEVLCLEVPIRSYDSNKDLPNNS